MSRAERESRENVGSDVKVPPAQLDTVYAAIAGRRTAFDTLVWQVPSLGLTAQAFLLTLAYGPSSSSTARYVAGGLSIVIALVAIQTMLKHRANERTDNLILKKIEVGSGISVGGKRPHDPPTERGRAVGNRQVERIWNRPQSVVL